MKRIGFTLVEVMIAIGIFGVGMAMVASVFVAAVKQNRLINNSTLGTIICENGLTMAKLVFTADVPPYGPPWVNDRNMWEVSNTKFYNSRRVIDEKHPEYLPITEQRYPNGAADSPRQLGYAILIRKIDEDDDTKPSSYKKQDEGYQICCVAYRKITHDGVVAWEYVRTGDIDHLQGVARVPIIARAGHLRQGSPLVFQDTGDFGIITYIDRDGPVPIAILDRPILSVNNGAYAYFLKEESVLNPKEVEARSPAIATMFTRTGLRP